MPEKRLPCQFPSFSAAWNFAAEEHMTDCYFADNASSISGVCLFYQGVIMWLNTVLTEVICKRSLFFVKIAFTDEKIDK